MNSSFTDTLHPFYGKIRVITHDKGISHWIIKKYVWEEHILMLILKYIRPETTIIDIGANIGTHTIGIAKYLTENNQKSKIVAFEPQPFIFSLLQKNMERFVPTLEIDLKSCGLSNVHTNIYMDMPNYDVVENPGGYGLEWNEIPTQGKTEVIVKTLDSFQLENVSFIKIDVEGHENQVLEGAYDTIRKSKPVMIIEILGGVTLETATVTQLDYINDTKRHIESLSYTVILISNSDYLCIPLS
jgi:FkbM family methyltransferase